MKIFIYTVIGVVAAAIVLGFITVGSPQERRLENQDARRIEDLNFIQSQIVSYWQAKQKLPPSLEAMNDDIRGIIIPRDPVTGEAYEYIPQKGTTFELCAVFATANKDEIMKLNSARPYYIGGPEAPNFAHDAGRTCFTRTIDTDIYKPFPPVPAK